MNLSKFQVVDTHVTANNGHSVQATITYQDDVPCSVLKESTVTFLFDPNGRHGLAHTMPAELVDEVMEELSSACIRQRVRNDADRAARVGAPN